MHVITFVNQELTQVTSILAGNSGDKGFLHTEIVNLTEIIYIDTQNENNEKLLNDVLTYKRKEKLYLRRDEILKRLEENISKDEQEILQLELNQIIIEISKLKL